MCRDKELLYCVGCGSVGGALFYIFWVAVKALEIKLPELVYVVVNMFHQYSSLD